MKPQPLARTSFQLNLFVFVVTILKDHSWQRVYITENQERYLKNKISLHSNVSFGDVSSLSVKTFKRMIRLIDNL
jgi:hypothetical protein